MPTLVSRTACGCANLLATQAAMITARAADGFAQPHSVLLTNVGRRPLGF